jgi:hypothetical protein
METELICGHNIPHKFVQTIDNCAEIFGLTLDRGFVLKFYNSLLKDECVSNIMLSEEKEGGEIYKAIMCHMKISRHFPRPEELIMLIQLNNISKQK